MQLRWCLSAPGDWKTDDKNWRASKFYAAVIQAFGTSLGREEDDDDSDKNGQDLEEEEGDEELEWVNNALAWWDKCALC